MQKHSNILIIRPASTSTAVQRYAAGISPGRLTVATRSLVLNDEFEAGRWYARSISCYALLQALSGARFDAVNQVLYLKPSVPGDFRCFLSTASGYGVVGVSDGKPFVEIVDGTIPYVRIDYVPCTRKLRMRGNIPDCGAGVGTSERITDDDRSSSFGYNAFGRGRQIDCGRRIWRYRDGQANSNAVAPRATT